MKKKRKKKATSPFFPPPCLFQQFSTVTSNWPQGLGSAPDVPNKVYVRNGASESVKFACDVLSKECMSVTKNCQDIQLKTFLRQKAEHTIISYDTVQLQDQLFVRVPLDLSKDSFIELLDYAEESLSVKRVIVCIERSNPDIKNLITSFRFMSFESVLPSQLGGMDNINLQGNLFNSSMFHFMGYDLD
uniref:Ornithine decarboxylase antizyme n=1 Tax=Phallusia mammillata TaxID=59560 RepID=A0A6F9DNJ1_9ASCI|nr:ornithine decarboxylase antizyme-like [Phallusia mammillata]